jgi:hypothetical protein
MNWTYGDKEITELKDFPEGVYGFVYRITHTLSGKQYIGRKQLLSKRTLPPLAGTKRKRKVEKESDWKGYYGSHPEIKEMIKGGKGEEFRREIIEFAWNKKHLGYLEILHLFTNRVLELPDRYWNDNISGRYFRKDIPIKS